jgi:hypothetical protein
MGSRLLAVTFDAHRPDRLASFWAGLLRREVVEDAGGALLPGGQTQLGLRFAGSGSAKVGLNRVHPHLTSGAPDDQRRTVETALGLGARHLDVGQRPEEGHVVLADPEGNEFCVIGAGSAFLAGCGFLGELACDGTRRVGLFWSRALDWPLVWDENEETAVQSPEGGTKVAWGGPPVAPIVGRSRQRFDLVPAHGDQEREAARLISLGATRLGAGAGGVIAMADPDGNEFALRAG